MLFALPLTDQFCCCHLNNWDQTNNINNNKISKAYESEVDNRAINLTLGGKLRMSKQIRPPVSILGWYMGVENVTIGGWNGYLGPQSYSNFKSFHTQPN